MISKKLSVLVPLLLLQSGCSELYGYQSPAPLYGGRSVTNPYKTGPDKLKSSDRPKESVVTHPLPPQQVIKPAKQAMPFYSGSNHQSSRMSPAVVALMSESDRNSKAGDLESAVSVLERALRINPRNPMLTYRLAELRIKQGKPRLAEDLAKKAALLASGDRALKRKSWLLISKARRLQNNFHAAKEAKIKADSYINP